MPQDSHSLRYGALAGLIAAASMAATPAYAAQLPTGSEEPHGSAFGIDFAEGSVLDPAIYTGQAEEADHHRRRYRRYRRHRHNRIDAGDVFAGVLVLGGIAAIASAASNSDRRERERERRRVREEERRYDARVDDRRRSTTRSANGSGIDNAVSMCLNEIERDVRVDNVDGASRVASGWVVSGTLFNGSGFTCQIDNNGRISNVDYGNLSSVSYSDGDRVEAAPGQWSDQRYADARAAMGSSADIRRVDPDRSSDRIDADLETRADAEPLPAYPGGPLPGEEGYNGG